jgi:hypothetical protein
MCMLKWISTIILVSVITVVAGCAQLCTQEQQQAQRDVQCVWIRVPF